MTLFDPAEPLDWGQLAMAFLGVCAMMAIGALAFGAVWQWQRKRGMW